MDLHPEVRHSYEPYSAMRPTGYKLIEYGASAQDVYGSQSLDALLVNALDRIRPLGDGLTRLHAIREHLERMIEDRTKQALGLKS